MPDRFATVVTCIDGRIHEPLGDWLRDRLGVDYLDMITEPGPDRLLAAARPAELDRLLTAIGVSERAHGSDTLVLAGHADCAGNPVDDGEHHTQLRRAAARLAVLLPGTRILAVHTGSCGTGCWRPYLVDERPPAGAVKSQSDTAPWDRKESSRSSVAGKT
ncbi:carbonic anhydrase [Solwaraspora sp. WMMB335]|uniref:carbonic anhydrase n=1 Tax=Solwaraspora sp. WMMB335 TaxID=3404118 RepID=UPI003B93DF44